MAMFGQMGTVRSCKIIREPANINAEPYGFVEFADHSAAAVSILEGLNVALHAALLETKPRQRAQSIIALHFSGRHRGDERPNLHGPRDEGELGHDRGFQRGPGRRSRGPSQRGAARRTTWRARWQALVVANVGPGSAAAHIRRRSGMERRQNYDGLVGSQGCSTYLY